jgi:hypothetical protein
LAQRQLERHSEPKSSTTIPPTDDLNPPLSPPRPGAYTAIVSGVNNTPASVSSKLQL